MVAIPQIQIQNTPLIMEYKSTNASLEIINSKPTINYDRKPIDFKVNVTSEAKFEIDQSKAWEATGLGGSEFFSNQMYNESKQIVLQAIARIVEDGNRMAQITKGTVIHELHRQKPLNELPVNYFAPPSIKNVEIQFQRKEIEIEFDSGSLEIRGYVNPPQFNYTPPRFEAYVKQHNSVQIIPPTLDVTW